MALGHQNEGGTIQRSTMEGLLAMARRKRDDKTKDLFAFAEDNRPSIVYQATNTVNGKRYIGITRMGLEQRKERHFSHARNGRPQHFVRAIRKYGEGAFDFVVLENCESYKAAYAAERRWIAELKPEYNKTLGGEGILGHRHNAETRRKMSAAKNGRSPWPAGQYPAEVRAKLSAAGRARRYDDPSNAQLRAYDANRVKGNEGRRRPVICVTDGLAFRSLHEAEAYYGLSHVLIGLYCRGAKNQRNADRFGRKGLTFAYVKDLYEEAR